MTFKQHLIDINACEEARIWAGDKTAKECWDTCKRCDWLLWWARKENIEKKLYVKSACRIARLVIHLDKSGKGILAIEAAENWLAEPTENNRIKCFSVYADDPYVAYDAGDGDAARNAARNAAAAVYNYFNDAYYSACSTAANAYGAGAGYADIIAIIREIIPQPWTEPEAINLETGDGIVIKSNLGQ